MVASKEKSINYMNEPKVNYVHTRILELFALKSHKYEMYRNVSAEYKQYKKAEKIWDYARYRMNTAFALVNTKASEILSATPSYDFIAMDDDAKRYKKIRELLWNYIWTTSKTDYELMRIVYDALKYWTWWGMEYILQENRTIKEPKLQKDWTIIFEEKEITDYNGCKLEHIQWENVFVNWVDINRTSEACVVVHYDRDEFMNKYWNNKMYSGISEETIPYWKYYYVPTSSWEFNMLIPNGTNLNDSSNIQAYRKVSVLKYWNKYKDEYIVLANWVWINPDSKWEVQGIPSKNKEIPLVCWTDHYVEDDIYAMGEFEITKDSRDLKDESRSLILEVIKAQAWMITIDPDADWDEATLQLWIRKFARVNKDDISFFAPNINASTLQYLEQKLDDDIVIESWVDFKNQILWPNETATKTAGRIEASKKRINLWMKFNAYTFFERLGRLRMSNMEFYYSDKPKKIFVKWVDYNWTVEEPLNWWYGTFTIEPQYLKWECTILPVMDSLMGSSSEKLKQRFIEFITLVSNLRKDDGTAVVSGEKIIEAWRWIIDDAVDLDKLLETQEVNKSPEQMLKDSWVDEVNQLQNAINESAPAQWIPAAQRSWAPIGMASSPNLWQ